MSLIGDALLVIGAAFMFLGALGLLRMPDVYTRIQAGTKAVTLGSIAILLGIAVHQPGWWPKLLLIGLFILLTSPLGSSTIARATHLSGLEPWQAARDRPSPTAKESES
jgi:multicomponent Na+:H+ antiporter subunit G